MSKRKTDEIGPRDDGDDRGDSRQRSPAQLVAAARHGEEQLEASATECAPSGSTQTGAMTTGAAATAAAVRPFDQLAAVELQLIMRCCNQRTLLALARCSRFTLAAAPHPFAWQLLSPIDLRCDWPLELSGRLQPKASLLRHADISVIWRLRSAESMSAEQVTALAALPRLTGVSLETAFDPSVNGFTQLSDEGAALLFGVLAERIDHGLALTTLELDAVSIDQAGFAALITFIERSRSLTSLKITNASKLRLSTLAAALVQCRTLTSLELHHANADEETDRALATIIQQNSSLTTLILSHYELDDAAAVVLTAAVAHSRSLTDLQLESCELGDAGVEALVAALELGGFIRKLDLSWCCLGVPGAVALSRLLASDRCALTSLSASSNWIGLEGVLALVQALQTNRTLTELRLDDIKCEDEGIRALLAALRRNPQCCLRVLDLFINPLSASCASSLSEVISRSVTLEWLEVSGCDLGNEGIAALAVGIGRNRQLQHLNVSSNSVGVPGATALAAAIRTCSALTALIVRDNQIGDDGLAALAPALVNLRTLDVSRCQLTAGGARPLAALIQRSLVLESLDVSSNKLEARGISEIAGALDASSILRTLKLRSNSGAGTRATALAAALERGWKASKQ